MQKFLTFLNQIESNNIEKEQVGLITGMRGGLTLEKSIREIHHIS